MNSKQKSIHKVILCAIFGSLLTISTVNCGTPEITIMSANITSGDYSAYEAPGIRIFQGLAQLTDIDIVIIQEFNYRAGSLDDLVLEAFGSTYNYYIEPGGETIPNGIISRYPIISSGQWTDYEVTNRDFAWAVIDIPGEVDLQVVSVHLKSNSSSAGIRNDQALAIRDYVENQFDSNHYIVVGGDLNVHSTTEGAMNTFRTFLDVDDHTPSDQGGNPNTNEPRNKPYDWIMPNELLDECHIPLEIGHYSLSEGLVFDSWVYPSPLPSPIRYGDSHTSGMQHMPVMKTFLLNP